MASRDLVLGGRFLASPSALDAIHLASALVARQAIAGLALLSLDDRIRTAGRQLGIRLQPARS